MSTYDRYFHKFESSFFASITMGVLVSSIMGGIAAMAVLQNGTSFAQMAQLFFVVVAAIGFNGSILSQQSPRTIYNFLIASLMFNTMIAIVNFAM
ncbi:hypothetical protein HUK80_05115 [Flavobacterium sp. MAH-1]|uniref:Uncharacterized protein n=1 Tax=Flavobacterium agri TaxID=2743471 RepID=A0A7Y9C6E8_9FLAO|nr:hypothetical protein [Flavobacterium agri]NUY80268.1 hypothetical protein [Flavobacterium agri]NYA70293.1 hypothetical protein [Flavobacterium agri]